MAEVNTNMGAGSPEALHAIAKDKSMIGKPKFVNPGTPDTPLVQPGDLSKAQISGNGSERLRSEGNLIK